MWEMFYKIYWYKFWNPDGYILEIMGWISGFLEIIETPSAKHQWYNIGIKHYFHALASAGPRGRCWNPSLKGEGFNTSRVAQQMLMYQKSMFNRYYWIKHVFRSKTLEQLLQKLLFICTCNGTEKHVTCEHERFENAASRTKTDVIATVHFTDDDDSFYDGLGMLIRKTAKPCINSMWIVLLIHGLVLVKTCLLIACDTAFYAIMFSKINAAAEGIRSHSLKRHIRSYC